MQILTSDFPHVELVTIRLVRAGSSLEGLDLRRIDERKEDGLAGQPVNR